MLAFLKNLLGHPRTGMVLGILALLLMADTAYLNRVREQKAAMIETMAQDLEAYQASLQSAGNTDSLKPYLHRFQVGAFLKNAFLAFQEASGSFQLTDIDWESVPLVPIEDGRTPSFIKKVGHHKTPEMEMQLTLKGELAEKSDLTTAPYQQLNEVLEAVQTETSCELKLSHGQQQAQIGGEALSNKARQSDNPEPLALQFELQFTPRLHKTCLQRYIQLGDKK